MDKITRKTSFKQWLSPISTVLFEEQMNAHRLDYYTKQLHMASLQSQQSIHNQVFQAMIVFCLNMLAQLKSKSKQTYLQISRFLKAALWRNRKILGKTFRKSKKLSRAPVHVN